MCVIIVKPATKRLPRGVAKTSSHINPHGLGVIWTDTYEITYHKSTEYKVLETDRPFIAHFRYATVGKVCVANTHPFKCGKQQDEWLMMNGTIPKLGNHNESDSRVLARQLGDIPRREWRKTLAQHQCRFVTVNVRTHKHEIYNKDLWTVRDGIWYSKDNVLQANLVAVYGTLKRNESNSYLLSTSKFVGKGTTKYKYPLIVRGLPYLLDDKGTGHNVSVEVYRVSDSTMRDLDRLEGHPTFYERVEIPIKLKDGRILTCWVYFCRTVTRRPDEPLQKSFRRYYPKPKAPVQPALDLWPQPTIYEPYLREAFLLEDKEFDIENELPVCINCFNDLEYDNFSAYYCKSCGTWHGESEIVRFGGR